MAFDYSKLKGRIIEKYDSQSSFANAMEWSERTLSLSLTESCFGNSQIFAKQLICWSFLPMIYRTIFLKKKFKVLNLEVKTN